MLPSQYVELDSQEKAFIIAAITIKMEEEKEQEKKSKRGAKKPRKR